MPSPHWQLNDPDWLRSEYVENKRTGRDLAAQIGVHPSAVARALERHGIRKPAHRVMTAVPAEWLHEQHVEQRRSIRDIAAEVGVTPTSVRRALDRAGIPVHDGRLPPVLDDREWLAARKQMSRAEVAAELGVSREAVSRARRRHGMATGRVASRFPELDDPGWLADRYHGQGWTQQAIADELGCARSTVAQAMQRLGIPSRPPRTPVYPQLQDREWLARRVNAGRSPQQIASEIGCERTAVLRALRRLGLR